jgi:V8-like Glu-specific endopeptidase
MPIDIPLRMQQTRTEHIQWESQNGLFCYKQSTRSRLCFGLKGVQGECGMANMELQRRVKPAPSDRVDLVHLPQAFRSSIAMVKTIAGDTLGTAFRIGSNRWCTAAHVIEGYDRVALASEFNDMSIVAECHAHSRWLETQDRSYDVGRLATLGTPSHGSVEGFVPLVHSVALNESVKVVGFSSLQSWQLLSDVGPVLLNDGSQIRYHANSDPGQSGGPILLAGDSMRVCAINTGGPDVRLPNDSRQTNEAVVLRPEVLAFLLQ